LNQTKWKEYFSGGRKYYYNTETKESKWDMPDELLLVLEKVEKDGQQVSSIPPAGQGALVTMGGADLSSSTSTSQPNELNGTNGAVGLHTGGLPFTPTSILPARPNLPDDPVIPHNGFMTVEEGEKAFMHLLRKAGVDANWTWDQTMRAIITDPLYKALNTLAEKKAAWQKFTEGLRAKEQEERDNRLSKLRPALRNMLRGNPNVFHYTTFSTADKLFSQHPIWQQARIEAERRLIFEEYVAELKQREVQETRAARARSISKVVSLFKTLDVDVVTRWRTAHNLVLDSQEWKEDAELRKLPTLDILLAFEDYSRVREREFEEQMRRSQVEKTRKERKAREAFKELLGDLVSLGHLKARTKWKEIYPLFSTDERYLAMLGNPGSNPLELFWDLVDNLDQKLDAKLAVVEEAINQYNGQKAANGESKSEDEPITAGNAEGNSFTVGPNTTFEEFLVVVKETSAESAKALGDEDLQIVFQTLREQALKKQADEKRRLERKQRHLQDDLRYALKKLGEPLDINMTYEAAVPLIENLPEYKAIDDEESRRAAFSKFVKRQKERMREASEDGASTTSRKRKEPPRELERDRDRERERERDRDRERDRERSERDRDGERGGARERERERDRPKDYDRDRDSKSSKHHRGHDEYDSRGHRSSREYTRERERDRDRDRDRDHARTIDKDDDREADSKNHKHQREAEKDDRRRDRKSTRDDTVHSPIIASKRDERERSSSAFRDEQPRDKRAFGVYDEKPQDERVEKRARYDKDDSDISMKAVSDDAKASRADTPEEGEI
jgi:pre-mRNA-processing factor 40